MPRSSWPPRPSPSRPRSTAGAGRAKRSAGAARGSTCGGQPASVSCTSAGCRRRRSGGRDPARTWPRYRLRLDRQNSPLPGTRTVVVRRPLLLLLTRSGPRPVLAVTPRLDAVRRNWPSRPDLRKPKPTTPGRTLSTQGSSSPSTNHPRAGGENLSRNAANSSFHGPPPRRRENEGADVVQAVTAGPPPRRRGELGERDHHVHVVGTTPA